MILYCIMFLLVILYFYVYVVLHSIDSNIEKRKGAFNEDWSLSRTPVELPILVAHL